MRPLRRAFLLLALLLVATIAGFTLWLRSESALDSALPWDRIAGVPFQPSTVTTPVPPVAVLASEEDTRAQHDADYRWRTPGYRFTMRVWIALPKKAALYTMNFQSEQCFK